MLAVRTLPFRAPLARGVVRARDLPSKAPKGLPRGRLLELSRTPGAAATTAAVQILLASQREGDPVAWVQPAGGALYPPDLAAAGLDLGALLVVHVPPSAGRAGIPKAAEMILRTGAFGALALDVEGVRLPGGPAWLGRLASLTREHDCRCVFLAEDSGGSLGPLVSLRLRARRVRLRPGRFAIRSEVLKDKSGVRPTLPLAPSFIGPEGMF